MVAKVFDLVSCASTFEGEGSTSKESALLVSVDVGDTNSIYFGVNIKTKEIRKKAIKVFLSMFYLTGSSPPLNIGLHFRTLIKTR